MVKDGVRMYIPSLRLLFDIGSNLVGTLAKILN